MDMRDVQPRRKLSPMIVLPWVLVRITFPEGQEGDHADPVQLPVPMS